MNELVNFLRARLGEDEMTWRREQAEGSSADTPGMVDQMLSGTAAKRAITTRCERVLAAFADPVAGTWPDVSRRERTHADATLCDLAAIYANHPDYRQEWKP